MSAEPETVQIDPATRDAAEAFLREQGCTVALRSDGRLEATGDIHLSGQKLDALPDLSCVVLMGDFKCNNNRLKNLVGAPYIVAGSFHCYDNGLESLKGAPRHVGGGFYCFSNELASLDFSPETVGGDFSCHDNNLTSLVGISQVGGSVPCKHNKLITLDGAPEKFERLYTDFGEFASWDDVPAALAPDTKHRLKAAWDKAYGEDATVLQQGVNVAKPLRLRRNAMWA